MGEMVVHGLMRLRDPRTAGDRGVRILQKQLGLLNRDPDSHMDKEELQMLFSHPELLARLRRFKLRVPDLDVLFDELDADSRGELAWEEISDGLTSFWTI